MNRNDDRELVKRCIEGNAEAWGEFVELFSGLIYWAIKRKLNRYDCAYLMSEVEEIYQRIFTSLWEKKSLMSVDKRDNIAPWLVVLASNATIDFIRRKRFEEDFLRTNLEPEPAPQNQKDDISLGETKRLLDEAIKQLSGKEKVYLESYYMAGKKYKEIAEAFNTTVGSVATVIARAKSKIKKYIGRKYKEF